ncbi:unnamed protein product [Tilletia controversa]|uniref:Eukaryotic translation initiation factor 3 subunit M n=3 Tax=Tilletia TaxID=13289 RepID=A0A8X7MLU9_9BASI|nr:hypothetical protein CF336_g6955 [Tilletia laevis]KAE8187801.1 hypothetical protein CF328_g6800 [Tilletia controversa]KAE8250070.1 hypothetical protein A4X03_0g6521 [Tilletia caries]KAE8189778.1 hypothetical protein CF335_g6533 [Tilletia laevis]KAE8241289.1 hypothetical protein A4X06_0g7590 [Tilletia controversa]
MASAESVSAGASIVADSVTVLVDGAFPDHIQELTPFLARGVQPATAHARHAFVDHVRTAVGELAAHAGGEAAHDHHHKRIQILAIVVNALKTLPEPATDRELEGSFNLLLALILTSSPSSTSSSRRTDVELTTEQTELLTRLSELLASPTSSAASPTDRSIVKYRILTNFFNALPSRSPVRLTIFLSLLSLAAHSDDLDILSSSSAYVASSSGAAQPSTTTGTSDAASSSGTTSASYVLLYSLPTWLAHWSLDEERKKDVLKQVADILLKQTTDAGEEADPVDAARTLAFHKLYLRFLDAASSSPDDAASTPAAETTLALALRLPHVFDFPSLLESRAILGLEKSNAALWTLLVDVVLAPGGRGQRWDAWKAKNGTVLAKIGVSEAVLVRKIRLLDIASLCAAQVYSDSAAAAAAAATAAAQNPTSDASASSASSASPAAEVPYSLIASSALPSEPAEDVETWVIDVIRAGLVSGKLSQVDEVFRVYRVSSVIPLVDASTEGVFSRKQWEVLEVKLGAWRESVGRMLITLGAAAKQQQVSAAAAHVAAQAQAAGIEQQPQQQQQAQAVN